MVPQPEPGNDSIADIMTAILFGKSFVTVRLHELQLNILFNQFSDLVEKAPG